MTMQASIYGRLGRDPEARQTASGTAMVTSTVAVSMECRERGKDTKDETEWVNLVCFGRTAQALERHEKGDMIAAFGRVQLSTWTSKAGEAQRGFQLVADSIVSARTSRPGSRRKKKEGDLAGTASKADPARQGPAADDPDDEIPF